MMESIPEPIPDLPEDAERDRAQDAFLDLFLDLGRWEKESHGDSRSAAVLLGQIIQISVDTESLKRLTARLRHFLENEVVRRDFCASLEAPPPAASRRLDGPRAPARPR